MDKPDKYQKDLLDKLLSIEFPGVEELREQANNCKTETIVDEDNCGSFTIHPSPETPKANVEYVIPVEGLAKDNQGVPVEYLLHVRDGFMEELEVVVYSDAKLDAPLPIDDIQVMTYAERVERDK